MMYTSKHLNEFIRCKKIYCLLEQLLLFSGYEAASGGGGGLPPRLPPLQPPPQPSGGRLSQGTDVTIAVSITTVWCMRRRLDAPTKFECP